MVVVIDVITIAVAFIVVAVVANVDDADFIVVLSRCRDIVG